MKNILCGEYPASLNHEFKYFFRVMRILCILMTFCLSTFAVEVHSQNTYLTLKGNSMTVGQLVKQIEKQSNFLFVLNSDKINLNENIRVSKNSSSIKEILNEAFTGKGIAYRVEGDNIILIKETYNQQPRSTGRKISGKVVDVTGEAIIGASVLVKGTTNGTITDVDGNFTIQVNDNDIIEVSYIGYQKQSISVGNKSVLNISLKEDAKTLDEVVVIGYGTARKSDLTGALAQVTDKSFAEQNVTRVDQALQGRASGVQVSNTVGAPGGDVRIRIRGANSVLGDNSPLFVIDGFVGADYNLLNPNDIKSMEILKDASSTAIYGSRGANGVVLITTKSGSKDGHVKLSYSGNVSVSSLIKKYDILNAGDFATLVNQHDDAMGVSKHTFTDEQIQDYYKNGGFDYMDAVFRNAVSTEHQISVNGGNEKTQFRVSGNYLLQRGIVRESSYTRYTVRANINTKVNDKLSFRFNVNGASSEGKNNQARTGAGNPIVQAMSWAPTTNPYDGNGGYLLSDPVGSIKTNPLAMIYNSEIFMGVLLLIQLPVQDMK